jgi:FemAB-related protein (PEP-CTERM system-associated)
VTAAESARASTLRSQGPLLVASDCGGPEWDDYLSGHPEATADHLWGWSGVFARAFGHRPVYLAARRGATIAGVLPLVVCRSRLFGRSVTSLPFLNYGGVLSDDEEAAAALLEEARRVAESARAAHVEFRHVRRQFPQLPHRQHKLAFTRRLPATTDALWAETDRKVRNQVRKAQKSGLQAVRGRVDLLEEFYAVFAENMRDLGTPVYSRRLFAEALGAFPDRIRLTVVRRGAEPVAAAVEIRWKQSVLVPWASALRRHRSLCPNMLLYWTLLEQAVADGLVVFDFGRSSPGSGPHQFKLQWGAQETPLAWEYLLNAGASLPDTSPSNPKFRLAIEGWKRLPLGVANRLGPWIAAQLP